MSRTQTRPAPSAHGSVACFRYSRGESKTGSTSAARATGFGAEPQAVTKSDRKARLRTRTRCPSYSARRTARGPNHVHGRPRVLRVILGRSVNRAREAPPIYAIPFRRVAARGLLFGGYAKPLRTSVVGCGRGIVRSRLWRQRRGECG